MSLVLGDIEQVCPIEGYTEEEIKRCLLDLCNGNPDIRKDYLEWLGIKRLRDAIHTALQQGATRLLQFVTSQLTAIETYELQFQNKWLEKVEVVIGYWFGESQDPNTEGSSSLAQLEDQLEEELAHLQVKRFRDSGSDFGSD